MSWGGVMTCTVTNQTGGAIANLSVLHNWEQYQDVPNPNPTLFLEDGESISFEINVGAGGADEWSVTFTDSQGRCWYRNGKQCNVEEEDYNSVLPVNLNLLSGSQGFSIELPVSDSCTDNSYSPCP